jgi:glutathione S-transferase
MERQLGQTPYLAGGKLTLADIALVAYSRVAHEGGFDLSEFPSLRAWIARVERDLSIAPAEEAA